MFDLAARRQLNRGYNDGFTRALEIVLTPLLFGFLGRLVDNWLGTGPWFMLGFGAFAVSGLFARLWVGYDREMRTHEARLPKAGAATAPADTADAGIAAPVAPSSEGGT